MAQPQETVEAPGVKPDPEKAPPAVMEISDPPRASSEEAVYRDPLTRPVYCLSVKLIDTYKNINKVNDKVFMLAFNLTVSHKLGLL
jgi:hypothetical protein